MGLLQVFEVQLDPVHFRRVSICLQLFDSFIGMLFLLRKDYDLGWVVLQYVGCNTKAYPSRASSNNVDLKASRVSASFLSQLLGDANLSTQIRNILVRIELVAGKDRDHSVFVAKVFRVEKALQR